MFFICFRGNNIKKKIEKKTIKIFTQYFFFLKILLSRNIKINNV